MIVPVLRLWEPKARCLPSSPEVTEKSARDSREMIIHQSSFPFCNFISLSLDHSLAFYAWPYAPFLLSPTTARFLVTNKLIVTEAKQDPLSVKEIRVIG